MRHFYALFLLLFAFTAIPAVSQVNPYDIEADFDSSIAPTLAFYQGETRRFRVAYTNSGDPFDGTGKAVNPQMMLQSSTTSPVAVYAASYIQSLDPLVVDFVFAGDDMVIDVGDNYRYKVWLETNGEKQVALSGKASMFPFRDGIILPKEIIDTTNISCEVINFMNCELVSDVNVVYTNFFDATVAGNILNIFFDISGGGGFVNWDITDGINTQSIFFGDTLLVETTNSLVATVGTNKNLDLRFDVAGHTPGQVLTYDGTDVDFADPAGGGGSEALTMQVKVNEAGGVTKGQVVYISGATGGFPQASLADNSDYPKADVLAIVNEDGSDGQTITVTTAGLLEDIDTSSFTEGQHLYLGVAGAITGTHPSGTDAVQRLGHAVKINASTGSMIVDLDALTLIDDFNGTVRHQLVNGDPGNLSAAAYTVINDAGHRASISLTGENFTGFEEVFGLYTEGYGDIRYHLDGNHDHVWITDTTDSHNFSATEKMWLRADGELHTIKQLLTYDAVENDEHAMEIIVDAGGFGDVKALDIDYITGAIGVGESEGIVLVNVDETLAGGGEVFAFEVLSTTEGSDQVIGLKVGIGVDPISHDSGVFVDADSILVNAVDETVDLSTGGAGNVSIFVADNDTITVGSSTTFDEMEVILDTGASNTVRPDFEYSTGIGTWLPFVPTDGTAGFRNTGAILWESNDLAGWLPGTGGEYLVRITRTRNTLSTIPIADKIQVASPTIYSWNKNGDVNINDLTVNNVNGNSVYGSDLNLTNNNIDWAAATTHSRNYSGSQTLTFSNVSDGRVIKVHISGNNAVLTWPALTWMNSAPPILAIGEQATVTLYSIGGLVYGLWDSFSTWGVGNIAYTDVGSVSGDISLANNSSGVLGIIVGALSIESGTRIRQYTNTFGTTFTSGTRNAASPGSGIALYANGPMKMRQIGSGTFATTDELDITMPDTFPNQNYEVFITQRGTSPAAEHFSIEITGNQTFTIHSSNATSTANLAWTAFAR